MDMELAQHALLLALVQFLDVYLYFFVDDSCVNLSLQANIEMLHGHHNCHVTFTCTWQSRLPQQEHNSKALGPYQWLSGRQ